MKIGDIEAKPGEHAFGFLEVNKSRSGMDIDIPVHILAGIEDGPTLLVDAAVHGNEIIATIAILNVIEQLDPKQMKGNLIAVPVLNRSAFNFQGRVSPHDGKDILTRFPGDKNGSPADQIAYTYFNEVVRKADVMIDFHAGGRTAYERYVSFGADRDPANPTELERKRHKLAVAFGLDVAGYFPPGIFAGAGTEEVIEEAGVILFTPELGGGTGWHKNGEANVKEAERGIFNTLKAMNIIEGELETDGQYCTIYNANVVLWKPNADGLFIRLKGFGEKVAKDEIYALLKDPYTGDVLAEMPNTEEATVLPSGQNWLTVGSTSVGILGVVDRVIDVHAEDLHVSFD